MEAHFVLLAELLIVFLLLWTAASSLIVVRSKRRSYTKQSSSLASIQAYQPEPLETSKPTNSFTGPAGYRAPKHEDCVNEARVNRLNLKRRVAMLLIISCLLLLLGHLPIVSSVHGRIRSAGRSVSQRSDPAGLQEVFQVYQPVSFTSNGNNGCDVEVLLMEHVFDKSYGQPFVGDYKPPSCNFDTVRINLTVTSRGRQYDRLAIMYLGDTEVFRTSTAEPTPQGIVWTYIKEMSQYNSLWKKPQKLIFDLGNLINDLYTGSFNATLTAHFSYEQNVKTADVILPISARQSASGSPSAFSVPGDNATVLHKIPAAASRAVVSISACGQSQEEFWWSNVFSTDTEDFRSTVGELYGYSPFREVQLYIDGILAGVVWPFPIIFTGGVAPGFWHPIVGIDSFDLRQPEIDISPFLPLVQDGGEHSFEVRVTGLNISADGTATLSDTVGSYWVVTGTIFLYLDDQKLSTATVGTREDKAPRVDAPAPKFTTRRNLVRNQTGGNESLSYSVVAERTFSATSSQFSWSQTLSFSNYGLYNQQGYSQVNEQHTSGNTTITALGGEKTASDTITFEYPLLVNATYFTTVDETRIEAWMNRGLDIQTTGGNGISTYFLTSGPVHLHTKQSGRAGYRSVNGGDSTSWGDTADELESTADGRSYQRSVQATNGSVVYDTDPSSIVLEASVQVPLSDLGRDSVRGMLGRGPGNHPS